MMIQYTPSTTRTSSDNRIMMIQYQRKSLQLQQLLLLLFLLSICFYFHVVVLLQVVQQQHNNDFGVDDVVRNVHNQQQQQHQKLFYHGVHAFLPVAFDFVNVIQRRQQQQQPSHIFLSLESSSYRRSMYRRTQQQQQKQQQHGHETSNSYRKRIRLLTVRHLFFRTNDNNNKNKYKNNIESLIVQQPILQTSSSSSSSSASSLDDSTEPPVTIQPISLQQMLQEISSSTKNISFPYTRYIYPKKSQQVTNMKNKRNLFSFLRQPQQQQQQQQITTLTTKIETQQLQKQGNNNNNNNNAQSLSQSTIGTTSAEAITTLSSENSLSSDTVLRITIRFLEIADVPAVTTMCLKEYGPIGPDDFDIPLFMQNPNLFFAWYERYTLKQLIYSTSLLKTTPHSMNHNTKQQQQVVPKDHAVLVLCLNQINTNTSNQDKNVDNEIIIGMIEVSQQPVIPERNPPPYPLPIWFKELYWEIITLFDNNKQQQINNINNKKQKGAFLQGWITNLLITEPYRGNGYSKLLVYACEKIAQYDWNCQSIHLHCDADTTSSTGGGKIPYQLYHSLGYEPLTTSSNTGTTTTQSSRNQATATSTKISKTNNNNNEDYSWMMQWNNLNENYNYDSGGQPPVEFQSSIFFVQDVPLLYLQKDFF